ncbi:hypothetical protein [Burkholderia pseudomultivorans]|uniref:hypothetical protein n=1 Tax=Burkholderia pseudomultivorans TaxID=1207504 RepID=UPI00189071C2|nr:hypothetical protein [Burkholderia pseudomultivorans]MBF5008633.1 hypothetical protein [Burkholderia pseudomultivorans]
MRTDLAGAFDDAWILRVIGKGNNERFVPVTDDASWTSTPATPARRSSRRRCRLDAGARVRQREAARPL